MHDLRVVREQIDWLREGMRRRGKSDALGPLIDRMESLDRDRRTSAEFGVPSLTLMENAGGGVAEYVMRRHPRAESIGIVCGKGNNGGDGFVAARKLHEAGKRVVVILLADRSDVQGDAAAMLARLPAPSQIAEAV